MATPLRSRRSTIVRALRELASDRRARDREGAYLADGVRLVEEALRREAVVELALTSPRMERQERGRELLHRLRERDIRVEATTDAVIAGLVGAQRHQGIVARVRGARPALDDLLEGGPGAGIALAWGVQDPGNLGGLVRVAAAAGARGLVASDGCADPWNPKAVRASAGAVFHLPVVRQAEGAAALDRLGSVGWVRRAAVISGGTPYTRVGWQRPFALILGGEGPGLPLEVVQRADEVVSIPMARGVDSLNVLSAATLLLFEAARVAPGP